MADLVFGDIGKTIQVKLTRLDNSVFPPVQAPLDITGCTVVIRFIIGEGNPVQERMMLTVDPTTGIVQYKFVDGDLVKPVNFNSFGRLRYEVAITFPDGKVFTSDEILALSIRDVL